MDINDIVQAIEKLAPKEFERWMEDNEKELSNFFYKRSSIEFLEMEFDKIFFNSIARSRSYNEYVQDKEKKGKLFGSFMELVSIAAEKLAIIGIDSLLGTLISDLHNTPGRLRLQALLEFSLVEDIESDYFKKLPVILDLLEESQILDADSNVRLSIDIILQFIDKAYKVFNTKGMISHTQKLYDLCTSSEFVKQHPLLTHPVVLSLLAGEDVFSVQPIEVLRDRLESSEYFKEIVENINNEYYNHTQIDHFAGRWWKYDNRTIIRNVLKSGRTDFREAYNEISPSEKVLLYCFFNMKKHFFTSYAVFERILPSLKVFFNIEEYTPIMIDLGCGPMTSGIAIADLMMSTESNPLSFTYVGVDIAPAMIERAKMFENSPLFSKTSFYYYEDWEEIDFSVLYATTGKNNPVIFNASYLFSSESLIPSQLAEFVLNVVKLWDSVYLIFQNPDSDTRNIKYIDFKSRLQHHELLKGTELIRYKATSSESSERVYYEILKFISP